MTRAKNTRQPVSSFGPQLLAALLKGAVEKVEIPCPDQRTMQWLQLRIQTLRGAMEREGHPQYALVTRARTARSWNQKKGLDVDCKLIIQPHDSQFSDILTKAGIAATDHDRDLLDDVDGDAPTAPLDFSLDDEIAVAHDPYAKFKEK
jgi:hypothetical protein